MKIAGNLKGKEKKLKKEGRGGKPIKGWLIWNKEARKAALTSYNLQPLMQKMKPFHSIIKPMSGSGLIT
jgi:hypothetical protein